MFEKHILSEEMLPMTLFEHMGPTSSILDFSVRGQ